MGENNFLSIFGKCASWTITGFADLGKGRYNHVLFLRPVVPILVYFFVVIHLCSFCLMKQNPSKKIGFQTNNNTRRSVHKTPLCDQMARFFWQQERGEDLYHHVVLVQISDVKESVRSITNT